MGEDAEGLRYKHGYEMSRSELRRLHRQIDLDDFFICDDDY